MRHRRRHDQDPFVDAYIDNWRRAGVVLILAVGLLLAWGLCSFLASSGNGVHPQLAGTVLSLLATLFGWTGIVALVVAGLLYVYAYFYPDLMARIDR